MNIIYSFDQLYIHISLRSSNVWNPYIHLQKIYYKENYESAIFLRDTAAKPGPARESHLARTASQSKTLTLILIDNEWKIICNYTLKKKWAFINSTCRLPVFKKSHESKGDKLEYYLQNKDSGEKIIRSLHKYFKRL